MLVQKCRPLPVECIVRGYLAGSGWAEYQQSGMVCGIPLPPGLTESARLPEPIFTRIYQVLAQGGTVPCGDGASPVQCPKFCTRGMVVILVIVAISSKRSVPVCCKLSPQNTHLSAWTHECLFQCIPVFSPH